MCSQHNLAIKNLWHSVFDYAPGLSKLSEFFESFLEWSNTHKISFDWTMHIHLLHWLCSHEVCKHQIDESLIKELLIASVTRWSMSGLDHINAKGILVSSPFLPNVGVGLWKNAEPTLPGKIVLVKLQARKNAEKTQYALSFDQESWRNLEWQSISP